MDHSITDSLDPRDRVLRYRPGEHYPCHRRLLCGCGPTPAWRCANDKVCRPSRQELYGQLAEDGEEGA